MKDRIDTAEVVESMLGQPLRVGGSGRRWWLCPFHPDRNPSFCVTPGFSSWRCLGCDARGDAPDLVMRLNGVDFPEAVRRLAEHAGRTPPSCRGQGGCTSGGRIAPSRPLSWSRRDGTAGGGGLTVVNETGAPACDRPTAVRHEPATRKNGLPPAEALALVERSRERLWSSEGLRYRRWLHLRGLTNATIRAAGLGWTSGVSIPTRGDLRYFRASGIVIPWFDGDRLTMVKIRQPSAKKPKYVEAFRDGPRIYPSPSSVKPGAPVILVAGEFDALLVGQAVGDLAAVVTLGSATSPTSDATARMLCGASTIFAAHDADAAGDRAAAGCPSRSIRVRPPEPDRDWTDAARSGMDLGQWWRDRLERVASPERLTVEEEGRLELAVHLEFDGVPSRPAVAPAQAREPSP